MFRSRWTRSTREVNTKEIEAVDVDGAAVAVIAKSRVLKVVSRLDEARARLRRLDA